MRNVVLAEVDAHDTVSYGHVVAVAEMFTIDNRAGLPVELFCFLVNVRHNGYEVRLLVFKVIVLSGSDVDVMVTSSDVATNTRS